MPILRRFADNPLSDRADLQRLARDLVEPLLPLFSPGRAHVRLGETRGHFGDPAGWLEGFARPLWGLAPLAAGGGDFEGWDLWQSGLANGTDPDHPEYWGRAGDYDQRSVEQGALGFGLAIAPERLWEPLAPDVRARLAAWLRGIDAVKLVENNWLFFRVLVHLGLRRVGEAWSPEQVARDLDLIERMALQKGWYVDGMPGPSGRDERRGDYYVPNGFHFPALLYAKWADDPERSARFIGRAQRFAEDFQHYFAADGAALPFGRSLTYRFAQGAFWGALAYADVEALPWGVIKGLYLRHLRWWMRQPIFSETGLLTVGYAYSNGLMAESYNSSQSPYWAMKAFLPLALPESHPFWAAEEAPLPPRRAVHTVLGAGLILTTDPRSRDVVAINPGQPVLDWPRHAPHKYSKAAYSTRFGFSVPASVSSKEEGGFDADLALSDDDRHYRRRDFCRDAVVRDGVAFSQWWPWPDVEVRTWILAEATGHMRIHHVRTTRTLRSFEGGFAVPLSQHVSLPGPGEPIAVIRAPAGATALRNLLGDRETGGIKLGVNGHLMTSMATMPTLSGLHQEGEFWLATWAGGSTFPDDAFEDATRYAVTIDPEGPKVTRDAEPWWSAAMGSNAARLQAMNQLA